MILKAPREHRKALFRWECLKCRGVGWHPKAKGYIVIVVDRSSAIYTGCRRQKLSQLLIMQKILFIARALVFAEMCD